MQRPQFGSLLRRLAALVTVTLSVSLCGTTPSWATDFTNTGDDLTRPEDGLVQLDGYFRLRGELLHNLDLDRGATPSGELFFPTPLSDPDEDLLTHADMRLRTDVSILSPTGFVGVKVRIDFLDNLALGSTPKGPPQGSTSQDPPEADMVVLKHAYGEVLTPFGLIAAGRMGNDFGLGMVANSGDCGQCDSGDAADRIAFVTPLVGHIWAVAYDFSAIGPTTERRDRQRVIDVDPSDDVRTVTFAVLQYHDELAIQRRMKAEVVTVDYGLYVSHRWQENDVPNSYLPSAPPDPLEPSDVIRRDFTATALSAWLRFQHPWMRIEAEAAALFGSIDQASLIPGVALNEEVTTTSFGAALETEFGAPDSNLRYGLDAGFASGDDAPGFGAFQDFNTTPTQPGDLNGPQAAPPNDNTADNFRFHPDYHVDRILFREIVGTVTDAVYVRPHITWRFLEAGPGTFIASLAGIASFAVEPESAPGGEQALGIELDPTIAYVSDDRFVVSLEHAVLFPLSGLNNTRTGDAAQPANLLRLRMMFLF